MQNPMYCTIELRDPKDGQRECYSCRVGDLDELSTTVRMLRRAGWQVASLVAKDQQEIQKGGNGA